MSANDDKSPGSEEADLLESASPLSSAGPRCPGSARGGRRAGRPGIVRAPIPWIRQAMFERISVNNYRGFNDVTVGSLGRINLVAGRNNAGKTTLLEAVWLLCGAADPRMAVNNHVVRLVRTHGEQPSWMAETYWKPFFHGLDTGRSLTVSGYHESVGDMKLEIAWERSRKTSRKTEISRAGGNGTLEKGPYPQIPYTDQRGFTYTDPNAGRIASEVRETTDRQIRVRQERRLRPVRLGDPSAGKRRRPRRRRPSGTIEKAEARSRVPGRASRHRTPSAARRRQCFQRRTDDPRGRRTARAGAVAGHGRGHDAPCPHRPGRRFGQGRGGAGGRDRERAAPLDPAGRVAGHREGGRAVQRTDVRDDA